MIPSRLPRLLSFWRRCCANAKSGQPLTLRRLALLTGSAILLTSVKSVYVPLWLRPGGSPQQFVNRRRRLLFLLFWTFLILLILSFAILPGLIHPEPGGDSGSVAPASPGSWLSS
jgi:hypothetical protein